MAKTAEDNIGFRKLIQLLITTLIVGFFLMAVVFMNKASEAISADEEYEKTTYGPVTYFLKAFDGQELSEEERSYIDENLFELASSVKDSEERETDFAIYDFKNGTYLCSDENDNSLKELALKDDRRERAFNNHYDYLKIKYSDYNLVLRTDYGGILRLLNLNGSTTELILAVVVFMAMLAIVFLLFNIFKDFRSRRIIGFVFITVWIGMISLLSSRGLTTMNQEILTQEKDHTVSLISYYYKQDLMENGDSLPDHKAWAETVIEEFTTDNPYLKEIKLNDNYHEDQMDIADSLDVSFNDESLKNRKREMIMDALLFIVLAFLLYDETSRRILADVIEDKNTSLNHNDEKMLFIITLSVFASVMVRLLMVPRLIETYKLTFDVSGEVSVASIYSIGTLVSTLSITLSKSFLKIIKDVKKYFVVGMVLVIIGNFLFAFLDNFYLNCFSYLLICFAGGLANMQLYFYIAGADEKRRNDLITANTRQYGMAYAAGNILGGVLSSIFSYRAVILFASAITLISLILVAKIKKEDYHPVTDGQKIRINLSSLFKKKKTLLYIILIVLPLAFTRVYLDYKFPTDILNLGYNTSVISFVLMIEGLIATYASKHTAGFLSRKSDARHITYLYVAGTIVIMLINQLSTSVSMIILIAFGIGLLDSFGGISYYERFYEIGEKEELADENSSVIIKTADRLGVTLGSGLMALFNNVIVLPVISLIAFITYLFTDKDNQDR